MTVDPLMYGWWLASRTAGIVGLVAVSASVATGLYTATRGVPRRPGAARVAADLHRQLAVAGLLAVAVHAITLLGDPWLHPGPAGVLVPGAISYRPAFVACGIVGAYLAIILGASHRIRRRIGVARWKAIHRLTLVAYVLIVVHALGAGTDGATVWMRGVVIATFAPALFNLVRRVRPRARPAAARSVAPRAASTGPCASPR